jgi:hypothetical protein
VHGYDGTFGGEFSASELLNLVFGFALTEEAAPSPATFMMTVGAGGTLYATGPASIPDNNGTSVNLDTSLPIGALDIYSDGFGRSAVATMEFGEGKIAFLGWDWFLSDPPSPGEQDGGWQTVLDLTVQEVAPTIRVDCPADMTVECDSHDGKFMTLPFTWSDRLDRHATVVVHVDGVLARTLSASPGPLPRTDTFGFTYTIGEHLVEVTATNSEGQETCCMYTVTVEDTTPPDITCPPSMTVECTDMAGTPVDFAPPDVTDLCDPFPTLICDFNPGDLFPLGTTTVCCTAEDAYGNAADCCFDVTVVDTTPPDIDCPLNMTVDCTGPGGTAVTYPAPTVMDCDPAPTVVYTPRQGTRFPLGSSPVDITVTDGSGNSSTCRFFVTVVDRMAPTVSCPPDITAECTGIRGATVRWRPISVLDDCDPAPVLQLSHRSGGLFPLGTTEVVARARDASGNVGRCTFRVIVVDTTAPDITCPPDHVAECAGPLGTPVAWDEPVVSDMCDLAPVVTCDPPLGSLFPVGTTPVVCTATDASGNTSSCTFEVTVEDTTAPVITCLPDIRVDATEPGGARVIWLDTPAMDVCDGPVPVTCVPGSGSLFPLGTTDVVCTATDMAGNEATCTFQVTVIETPRMQKERAMLLLRALIPVGAKKADDRIVKAIERIQGSLAPRLWVDGFHLSKHGHEVFDRERQAVYELQKIRPLPAGAALAIATLVDADRRLALRAIDEMMRIDAKKAIKARAYFLKGEAAWAAGDADKAIEQFRHAWDNARKV